MGTCGSSKKKRAGRKKILNYYKEQAENLRAWWKQNLKNLSKHALLLDYASQYTLLGSGSEWPFDQA
jgi:hypothetical protein